VALIEKILPHLEEGKAANTCELDEDDRALLQKLNLLSAKPMLFACNVEEGDLADAYNQAMVQVVIKAANERNQTEVCVVSAQVEAELMDFDPEEAKSYLEDLGISDSGVNTLIASSYKLLGLASYLTAGEMEVRAWTFTKGMKAPQCAGVIHTDFEKGFIKAEVVAYEELIELGSVNAAREAGKYRLEGKDYLVEDGDVILFRFAT
jgi:GTP-binding protein YchF